MKNKILFAMEILVDTIAAICVSIYDSISDFSKKVSFESHLDYEVVYCEYPDQDIWKGVVKYDNEVVFECYNNTLAEAKKRCVAHADMFVENNYNN